MLVIYLNKVSAILPIARPVLTTLLVAPMYYSHALAYANAHGHLEKTQLARDTRVTR